MRIGLLHHGNEQYVWGSVITTLYLQKALQRLGHDVWRISVTEHQDYPTLLSKKTDLIICEGVPEWQIPKGVWDTTDKKIFWWLSDLFYNVDTVVTSNFDGIATNSNQVSDLIKMGKTAARIDLAVDKDMPLASPCDQYKSDFVYVGSYPHKSKEQMDQMFLSCADIGSFSLWGNGWDESPYSVYYKGVLPLFDIGKLYKSVKYTVLLTETRQKNRGMINNRVFEALACGCLGISEKYDTLEKSDLGEFIQFSNGSTELLKMLVDYDCDYMRKKRMQASKYVIEKHNYDIRAKQFIELYNNL